MVMITKDYLQIKQPNYQSKKPTFLQFLLVFFVSLTKDEKVGPISTICLHLYLAILEKIMIYKDYLLN